MAALRESLLLAEDADTADALVPVAAAPAAARRIASWRDAVELFALAINYIFGAGVLGIPFAVAHGGIVASAVTLVCSSAICLVGMVWVLEAHERAAQMHAAPERTFEFGELCRMFIGPWAQRVYEAALTVFVVCCSWMYAVIFAVSLARTAPIFSRADECQLSALHVPLWLAPNRLCWVDYLIYLMVFAALMSLLVCSNVVKMKNLQLGLTAFGVTALLAMVATVLDAIPHDHLAKLDHETLVFNPAGYGGVFSSFVFAQLCHHGVPLLASVPEDKTIVRPVLVGVISTTTALYLVLGIVCALFFGVDPSSDDPRAVEKIITLNWQEYTAGRLEAHGVAAFLSLAICLYPAVTVSAAFPLYAITLGNSWYLAWHGPQAELGQECDSADDVGRPGKTQFYLAATLPSIILASVYSDVGFVLMFVGISAFVIAFFLPPLLQLRSRAACSTKVHTRYSWHFSHPVYCHLCLVFCVFALAFTLVSQATSE